MKATGIALAVIGFLLLIFFSIYGFLERDPSLTVAAGAALIAGCILAAAGNIAEAMKK